MTIVTIHPGIVERGLLVTVIMIIGKEVKSNAYVRTSHHEGIRFLR
jgi:hypothetical protein